MRIRADYENNIFTRFKGLRAVTNSDTYNSVTIADSCLTQSMMCKDTSSVRTIENSFVKIVRIVARLFLKGESSRMISMITAAM